MAKSGASPSNCSGISLTFDQRGAAPATVLGGQLADEPRFKMRRAPFLQAGNWRDLPLSCRTGPSTINPGKSSPKGTWPDGRSSTAPAASGSAIVRGLKLKRTPQRPSTSSFGATALSMERSAQPNLLARDRGAAAPGFRLLEQLADCLCNDLGIGLLDAMVGIDDHLARVRI